MPLTPSRAALSAVFRSTAARAKDAQNIIAHNKDNRDEIFLMSGLLLFFSTFDTQTLILQEAK
jgi:hypothetical protein